MTPRLVVPLLCGLLLVTGCSGSGPAPAPSARPTASATASASPAAPDPTTPAPSAIPAPPVVRPSLERRFDRVPAASPVRLGAVRERAAAYTSYEVSYRSDGLRLTGVLDVPTGPGPFPAVVLAHGWTDRATAITGQGMTRERGYLASTGHIALCIDYRSHAGSDDDPDLVRDLFLGYAVDALGAVAALRASDLPVDDDRVALMGRSMGDQVVLQALEIAPGYVDAGIVYSGQSSDEADNYDRWGRTGDTYAAFTDRHGTPEDNPAVWAAMSTRTWFPRITEPVLMIHGTADEQCPARWARATRSALATAGVDVRLRWYEHEHHAFGPRFEDSMRDTVRFLRAELR